MTWSRHSKCMGGLGALVWTLAALPSAASAQGEPATPPGEPIPLPSMSQATTSDEDLVDLQARSHFRIGREHYDAGRFAEAAREFEIAHGLSGRDALLFNVYLAYRDAQDTPNAARALRAYLATSGAGDREHLSARLVALDAQLEQERLKAEQGRLDTERREREAREAEAERRAAEARAREAERRAALRPSRPWWPWLLVGGGVAVTGTGVALGVLAKAEADELRAACVADPRTDGSAAPLVRGTSCAPSVDLESRRDDIGRQALIGDALWIGGGVLTATGLVLAFALPDEYPDESPVAAACSSMGCGVSVRFGF